MQGGRVVSPKSVLEPDTCITWLGKKIDGSEFSMPQTHTKRVVETCVLLLH